MRGVQSLKHSFVVGKTYQDHICAYKVVSIDGDRLVCKAADGIHEGSAEAKWRIYSNILSGQSAPHTSRSLKRPQSAIGAEFFTYEEVAAIFADVIKAYDKSHNDF